ncbi:hypothetical protein CYFUS_001681 [Cystobacter fuscus]|uniref:Uncharacterized protein n=1 Tax=Cystobacter fuscus TaxID=43 RepID=A0A250IYH9_9BACT|nr:hypothetical protein [Cystobacter fuscus]ATB36267.1 hypothetical protein CYFUS_001681 [Cystobacter fuscus]
MTTNTTSTTNNVPSTPPPEKWFKYSVLGVVSVLTLVAECAYLKKPSEYSECKTMCGDNRVAFFRGGVANEYEAPVPAQCQCYISQAAQDGGIPLEEGDPSVAQSEAQGDAGVEGVMQQVRQTAARAWAKVKPQADAGTPASAVGVETP